MMPSSSNPTARTSEVVNVQALRAFAALTVVLHHLALAQFGIDNVYGSSTRFLVPFVSFGQFGVDLFFVISGFIMVVTTWRLMGTSNAGSLFFLRRVIRIYPPYWLAVAPVLVAHAYLAHQGLHILGGAPGSKTNLLATFLLLPHPSNEFMSLPPAWTLVFEMSFYIVFACLLSLRQRLLLPALVIWFFAEVVFALAFGSSDNFILAFLGTPLPIEFIGGAFIGLLYVHAAMPMGRLVACISVLSVAALWISEIMLGDVAYAHYSISDQAANALMTYHNTLGRVLIAGIPAFLLVYGAVALEMKRLYRSPAWLVRIGDASYALYLWNLLLIVAARQIIIRLGLHTNLQHALAIVVTFASIVAVSFAVYAYFERPVTKRLHRLLMSFVKTSIVARSHAT
jgi:peptidoglycan/LPS O-acetylase OafA/YrhL